jgi:hypothetical protein
LAHSLEVPVHDQLAPLSRYVVWQHIMAGARGGTKLLTPWPRSRGKGGGALPL